MAKYLERISKNYRGLKRKPTSWLCSHKRDGLFGHMERGTGIISRDGAPFPGFTHIEKEVHDLLCDNHHITHVQGELYAPGIPFQTLQGIIRGDQPEHHVAKKDIRFHVFHVGGAPDNAGMARMIKQIGGMFKYPYLIGVDFWLIDDENVEAELERAELLGYEGLVLRTNDRHATSRETKTLFKVKGWTEMDLMITGFEEGKGHIKGMLGKLFCEGCTEDHGGAQIEVTIGSGFKKTGAPDSREALWKIRDGLLGKTIEVFHEGVTLPNKQGICSLTKARYHKMKEDR